MLLLVIREEASPSEPTVSSLLPPDTTVGVFHLRAPSGQYKLTFDKAKEACAEEAATMATYNQLSYAQKVGPMYPKVCRGGKGF